MWQRRNIYLGLDIGTHTTKIIQLKSVKGKGQLMKVLALPTPKEVFEEGRLEVEVAGGMLKALRKQHRLVSHQVISVLQEKSVITRQIRMPAMPEEEIAASLQWEVEKYIPLSGKDLVFDHVNMGIEEGEQGPENSVLLIGLPKKIVYPYCELLVQANYQPEALETVPFALKRSLYTVMQNNGQTGGFLAALDLGASGTNVVIYHGRIPVFSRHIAVGGNTLTQTIAEGLQLTWEEAEVQKVTQAEIYSELTESDQWDETKTNLDLLLRPVLTDLATEIRRCLDYVKIRWKGHEVDNIYLTGGTALLRGLTRFMSEQLEIPVGMANPNACLAEKIDQQTPKELLNQINAQFCVPMGLAFRGVMD